MNATVHATANLLMPSKSLTLVYTAAMVCGMVTPVFGWDQALPPRLPPALMLQPKPVGAYDNGQFDGAMAPTMRLGPRNGLASSPCATSIGQAMRDATHPRQAEPEQEKPTIHNQFQPVYRLHHGIFAWPAFPDPARMRTR